MTNAASAASVLDMKPNHAVLSIFLSCLCACAGAQALDGDSNSASSRATHSAPDGDAQVPSVVQLFNGRDLAGWHADVPAADDNPAVPQSFGVRDGLLVSHGTPGGHLLTNDVYSNYELLVEYRFAAEAGNCGVLVHATTPRRLYGMFPQSIECQLHSGNAGDFWCIGEDIVVPEMESRRGPRADWGVDGDKARRILNLTDGSERPVGEWNTMKIECREREIRVWVNDALVNHGTDCTTSSGRIALQAEGVPVEFRRLALTRLD